MQINRRIRYQKSNSNILWIQCSCHPLIVAWYWLYQQHTNGNHFRYGFDKLYVDLQAFNFIPYSCLFHFFIFIPLRFIEVRRDDDDDDIEVAIQSILIMPVTVFEWHKGNFICLKCKSILSIWNLEWKNQSRSKFSFHNKSWFYIIFEMRMT